MLLFITSVLIFFNAEIVASWTTSQNRLVNTLLETYDKKVKPTRNTTTPIVVSFSMELYQIIEVNEPQQFVLLNAWIGERWRDELLYWDPAEYENISEIMLPHDVIWMPDTTLYNTLIMKAEDARRLMNAKLVTNTTDQSVYIELLYPTIYKFSCQLFIYYFPFDSQICKMTFGSWTYDKIGIDYWPHSENVGTSHFLENEGWILKQFKAVRHELKYACCPNNYTNLVYTLHIQRKPVYYIANQIIPTCIITLISIVGFFTPSSASGERNEKISLGITTLLSMSILLLMISDQMPSTSTYLPLIGWFFLAMINLISMGTIMSSVIIAVQKRGLQDERLSPRVIRIASWLSRLSFTRIPRHLNKDEIIKNNNETLFKTVNQRTPLPRSKTVGYLLLPTNHHFEEAPRSLEKDANKNITSFASNAPKSRVKKRKPAALAMEEKISRELIGREFEWLATVLERWSLFFFLIIFVFLSVGINALGLVHWIQS